MLRILLALGVITLSVGAVASARAQATLPNDFSDDLIVDSLSTPTSIAFLPDGRLLVTEQLTARVRLVVNGALAPVDPVGVVPEVRNDNFFRGLLGITVDPRWPEFPYIYVHYAATGGRLLLSRFTLAGDLDFTGDGSLTMDPATRYDLITELKDAAHNGGAMRFGPDNMLYVSVGDSIYSPCAAQNPGNLRGSILRLDVRGLPSGGGGPPPKALIAPPDNPFPADPDSNVRLLWVTGLRNPFRFHVDSQNGELFVSDVGESGWEELNHVPGGGGNYGWPLFEGPDPFTSCPGVDSSGTTQPIHVYDDGASIIAAGIYRPPVSGSGRFPFEYEGDVFFSDYYNGALRRLEGSGTSWSIASPVPGQPNATDWATGMDEVSDYAQASDGSLWYCRQGIGFAANTGQIRRIHFSAVLDVPAPRAGGTALAPPWPQPARGTVALEYSLAGRAPVSLTIHDVAGRLVKRIAHRVYRAPGTHRTTWNGRDESGALVAAGIYFVRLRVREVTFSRSVVLAR